MLSEMRDPEVRDVARCELQHLEVGELRDVPETAIVERGVADDDLLECGKLRERGEALALDARLHDRECRQARHLGEERELVIADLQLVQGEALELLQLAELDERAERQRRDASEIQDAQGGDLREAPEVLRTRLRLVQVDGDDRRRTSFALALDEAAEAIDEAADAVVVLFGLFELFARLRE